MSSPQTYRSRITAIGSYVPERRLTNADLEQLVDTNDEWIVQRTGIRERRICGPEQYTSDLCIGAVQNLLDRYPVTLDDVELILVCTSTPDFTFPSTACLVQTHFGIPQTTAWDLCAACAGFVYGLNVANGMIASGVHRKVLVIGAEALSKITDYTDRTTCILFGDGAGAVLIERDTDGGGPASFLAYTGGSDGSGGKHLYNAYTAKSWSGQELAGAAGKLVQNGREVYKFAVQTVPRGVEELLRQTGLTAAEIDWFVPHSANLRIIESVCEKTGIPLEKTLHTIEQFGNTSAATIPLAIDQAVRAGQLKEGDRLLLFGFGGGFVYGGLLLQWRALPH
ncbi:ketoacyl-ACP synthase III [Paenibacillus cremeus]|uniref:Beta-ketoacyl-[acyl-carrier-protein] synthase III n=2 Tax=Paenibacillus cremeus TaxID=2163881 RepID=A0A559KIU2_9BACL|nr:ketoacyl-ACP synthase III [Paenibacillus cremeus]